MSVAHLSASKSAAAASAASAAGERSRYALTRALSAAALPPKSTTTAFEICISSSQMPSESSWASGSGIEVSAAAGTLAESSPPSSRTRYEGRSGA